MFSYDTSRDTNIRKPKCNPYFLQDCELVDSDCLKKSDGEIFRVPDSFYYPLHSIDTSIDDYRINLYSQYLSMTDSGDVIMMSGDYESVAANFPFNIKDIIWAHPGIPDEESWYLLGMLEKNDDDDDELYFLYDASCDYTGFDCRGDMNLYISNSLEEIINMAMTNIMYTLYIQETVPVDNDT